MSQTPPESSTAVYARPRETAGKAPECEKIREAVSVMIDAGLAIKKAG